MLATPETILGWYRRLIAAKFDGSSNLNAHAERFVRSIKTECLSKVVPLGEAHLRKLVREYVDHYHEERTHQGLHNRIPFPRDAPVANAPVRQRGRLGGLLRYYYRDAA